MVDLQYFPDVGLCLFNPTFHFPPVFTLAFSVLDHLSEVCSPTHPQECGNRQLFILCHIFSTVVVPASIWEVQRSA